MKIRFSKTWLVILLVILCLLVGAFCLFNKRLRLIISYCQLMSSDNIRQRLKFIPPNELLRPDENAEMISVGYAEFAGSFPQIESISNAGLNVVIRTSSMEIIIVSPIQFDLESIEKSKPAGNEMEYKERLAPKRGKLVLVPYAKSEIELKLEMEWTTNPYAFRYQIMTTQPKSLSSVALMNMDELYTYLYMLEYKCYMYHGQDILFFQTKHLKGFLDSNPPGPWENSVYVIIWDTDKKFQQPIIIKYPTDLLSIDEIKTFFSSFRYTVNSLPDNFEKRQELIVDSIKKHPAYVLYIDDNTETPLIGNPFQEETMPWRTRELEKTESLACRQKYLKELKEPKLSSGELIKYLRASPKIQSTEMRDAVNWYVKNGNTDVIRQLITNLNLDVEIELLPDEKERKKWFKFKPYASENQEHLDIARAVQKPGNYTIPIVGPISGYYPWVRYRSSAIYPCYQLLSYYFGPSDRVIREVLHDELCRYSQEKNDPHLIHFLMEMTWKKDKYLSDWYTQEIVFDEVMAYLRIYSNYEDWPIIRYSVYKGLLRFEPKWHTSQFVDKLLLTVDEQDVQTAFKLYRDKHSIEKRKVN